MMMKRWDLLLKTSISRHHLSRRTSNVAVGGWLSEESCPLHGVHGILERFSEIHIRFSVVIQQTLFRHPRLEASQIHKKLVLIKLELRSWTQEGAEAAHCRHLVEVRELKIVEGFPKG